jgi:twitching motility protein PilT
MNRTQEIIDYLSKPDTPNELVIAPHAPPIIRINRKISVGLSTVFDAQDISDTIAGFRSKALASATDETTNKSGSFSFGIRSIGRFRVNYLTQRGTFMMIIIIIPNTIPAITGLCEDPAVADKAMSIILSGNPGLIAICGANATKNSIFAYSLLQYVNQNKRTVIYTIENILTFLMKHENSIIIQTELHTDIETMNAGINNASLFEPDIIYASDIKPYDNIPTITPTIENGALVIASSVLLTGKEITEKYYPTTIRTANIPDLVSGIFTVMPGQNGKLSVTYSKAFTGIYSTPTL